MPGQDCDNREHLERDGALREAPAGVGWGEESTERGPGSTRGGFALAAPARRGAPSGSGTGSRDTQGCCGGRKARRVGAWRPPLWGPPRPSAATLGPRGARVERRRRSPARSLLRQLSQAAASWLRCGMAPVAAASQRRGRMEPAHLFAHQPCRGRQSHPRRGHRGGEEGECPFSIPRACPESRTSGSVTSRSPRSRRLCLTSGRLASVLCSLLGSAAGTRSLPRSSLQPGVCVCVCGGGTRAHACTHVHTPDTRIQAHTHPCSRARAPTRTHVHTRSHAHTHRVLGRVLARPRSCSCSQVREKLEDIACLYEVCAKALWGAVVRAFLEAQ